MPVERTLCQSARVCTQLHTRTSDFKSIETARSAIAVKETLIRHLMQLSMKKAGENEPKGLALSAQKWAIVIIVAVPVTMFGMFGRLLQNCVFICNVHNSALGGNRGRN